MSALVLDYTGDQVGCDYPNCVLDAFHDGDHVLRSAAVFTLERRLPTMHCVVCGNPFIVYGAEGLRVFQTCGQQSCMLDWARRHAWDPPLMCSCAQRPYSHELGVHKLIKFEAWEGHGRNQRRRLQWPWSLYFSQNGGQYE